MNLKRIFGSMLTVLGTAELIHATLLFMNTQGGMRDVKALGSMSYWGCYFLYQVSGWCAPSVIMPAHNDPSKLFSSGKDFNVASLSDSVSTLSPPHS